MSLGTPNTNLSPQAIDNATYDTTVKDRAVTLSRQIAGEDLTNDVLKVQERNSYANYTTSAANVTKSAAGFLHTVTVNAAPTSAIEIYDNSAASGNLIATLPASAVVGTYTYDVIFTTGLTVNTASADSDVTISYT